MADNVEVSPMEEVIADADVDSDSDRNEKECEVLVEMHQNVTEEYGCVLALV